MQTSSLKFSDPRLERLEFYINDDFDAENFNGIQIANDVTKLLHDSNGGINTATMQLSLFIGDKESSPFYIIIKMSADFYCDDTKLFNKLIDTNAPALLLSYSRPIVSLITAQSKYPSFDIPFINFKSTTQKED